MTILFLNFEKLFLEIFKRCFALGLVEENLMIGLFTSENRL